MSSAGCEWVVTGRGDVLYQGADQGLPAGLAQCLCGLHIRKEALCKILLLPQSPVQSGQEKEAFRPRLTLLSVQPAPRAIFQKSPGRFCFTLHSEKCLIFSFHHPHTSECFDLPQALEQTRLLTLGPIHSLFPRPDLLHRHRHRHTCKLSHLELKCRRLRRSSAMSWLHACARTM